MSGESSTLKNAASLVIALLVPVWWVLFILNAAVRSSTAWSPDWYLALVVPLVVVTVGGYFVSGFRWARWVIAAISLIFAASQFYLVARSGSLGSVLANSSLLLLLLLSAVAGVNAVWLLGSYDAKAFYQERLAGITARRVKVLQFLRWSLLLVVVVGVVADLVKMLR